MSTPHAMRKVNVWRKSLGPDPDRKPRFKGDWYLGDGWKKENLGPDVVIECREIYFSLIWRSIILGKGRTLVFSRQLWTLKSRNNAKFFYGNGRPYDGFVTYEENAYDTETAIPE